MFSRCYLVINRAGSRYQCRHLSTKRQINAAVMIERLPVISPPMNIIEKTIHEYLLKLEDVESLYCDHELRHFEDIKRAERLAKQTKLDEKDVEAAARQTAQDFEDKGRKALEEFKFAPRSFGPDVEQDKKSLDRCLDKRLMLITKIKIGDDFKWLVPNSNVQGNESLRQAAERSLGECFESCPRLRWLSNAPACVYNYDFGKSLKNKLNQDQDRNLDGVSMFVFKAQIEDPKDSKIQLNQDKVRYYQWLNRSEIEILMGDNNQDKFWKAIKSTSMSESVAESVIVKILNNFKNKTQNQTQQQSAHRS